MSYTDSKLAINQMVVDLLTAQGLENDTQWENTELTDLGGRAVWASVEVNSATPGTVTMGKGGSDRMVGFVSIMYSVPTDSGTGVVDALIEGARQMLPAGKSFTEGGTRVIVTAVGTDAGTTVDSWFVRPLNIFYRTDLVRASF